VRPKREGSILKSESLSPASRHKRRTSRRLENRRGKRKSNIDTIESATSDVDASDDEGAEGPGSEWADIDPDLTLGDLLPTKFAHLTDQELIEAGMKLPDIINSNASMA